MPAPEQKPTRVKRTLSVPLSTEEKLSIGDALAEILGSVDEHNSQLDELRETMKFERDAVDKLVREAAGLAVQLRLGESKREVDCDVVVDFAANRKYLRRCDTGEQVEGSEEALTAAERQGELDLDTTAPTPAPAPAGVSESIARDCSGCGNPCWTDTLVDGLCKSCRPTKITAHDVLRHQSIDAEPGQRCAVAGCVNIELRQSGWRLSLVGVNGQRLPDLRHVVVCDEHVPGLRGSCHEVTVRTGDLGDVIDVAEEPGRPAEAAGELEAKLETTTVVHMSEHSWKWTGIPADAGAISSCIADGCGKTPRQQGTMPDGRRLWLCSKHVGTLKKSGEIVVRASGIRPPVDEAACQEVPEKPTPKKRGRKPSGNGVTPGTAA